MSDDFRRRRRLSNTGSPAPRRSNGSGGMNPWFVTIFAAIVVIAGGWFLGQALARVFNGPPKGQSVAQAPTPLPIVTPPASASPGPTPEETVTPTEKPAPTPKVVIVPTQTAAPTPAPAPTLAPTPTPAPTPTEQPSSAATQAATQAPTQAPPGSATTPAAPDGESPAAHVVRAYINALRRGDPSTASNYLGNGAPDESFIDSATHINSITTTPNSDGSYKVEVDMRTSQGAYFETFTVASGKILEKTAIKP